MAFFQPGLVVGKRPKRRGLAKAKVALARKLAVVLHKMWTAGEDYRLKAAVG